MNLLRKTLRHGLAGLVGALFAVSAGVICMSSASGAWLVQLSYDLPYLFGQDWLSRLATHQERLMVICFGVIFGVGLGFLRPFQAFLATCAGVLGIGWMGYLFAVKAHAWFAWGILALQVVIAGGWSVIFNSVRMHIRERLAAQLAGMYLSPTNAAKACNREQILTPGADKRELTVFFSHIAGFDRISEGLDSDELARLMNGYFEKAVRECIHGTEGTVLKFVQDGIFAIWNAPEPQPDHQERACRAALSLRDELMNIKGLKPGIELRTRIGMHTGMAKVGNFGSSNRVDYTAMGETVRLAARVQELTKILGTDLMITGEVERAVRGLFVTRFLGRFRLREFAKPIELFELVGLPEAAEASRGWRDAFGEALRHFREGDLAMAELGFKKVVQLHPKDGPGKYYLSLVAGYRDAALPEGWNGDVVVNGESS